MRKKLPHGELFQGCLRKILGSRRHWDRPLSSFGKVFIKIIYEIDCNL